MGNLCSQEKQNRYKVKEVPKETKPIPSWEQRKKLDPKDFMFSKLKGNQTIDGKEVGHFKKPGSINGVAEFVIEECSVLRFY